MITNDKITEIFCALDEFCKDFVTNSAFFRSSFPFLGAVMLSGLTNSAPMMCLN
jgi:hypothetical protein